MADWLWRTDYGGSAFGAERHSPAARRGGGNPALCGSVYGNLCAGVPFMLATTTLGTIIRAEGAVKEGMVGNLATTAVNMILA